MICLLISALTVSSRYFLVKIYWNFSSVINLSACRLGASIPDFLELGGTNDLTLPSQVFISKNFSLIKEASLLLLKH